MSLVDKYLNSDNPAKVRIKGEYIDTTFEKVISPYSGEVVGKVGDANQELLDKALDNAHRTLSSPIALSDRAVVLDIAAIKIKEYRSDFAKLIATEAAKPDRKSVV